MNKFYLGIDASLTSPGFCLAKDNLPYVSSSNFKSNGIGMSRIDDIVSELKFEYFRKYGPVKIILEGLSFGSKGQGYLNLAELAGVIKYELFKLGYFTQNDKLVIVPPTTLKQFTTGKGNSDKTAMALQAYKEFELEFPNSDECDAFWLAQIGRALDGHWDGLNQTKIRESVIEKLKG